MACRWWIRVEAPRRPARAALDENLTHYKQQIPALFWFNALLIASNGTDRRVGSLTADWERFFEWKRIEREDEPRRVSLEVILRGLATGQRLKRRKPLFKGRGGGNLAPYPCPDWRLFFQAGSQLVMVG